MSLSPRGASVIGVGHPVKGWLIMLVGGVLAWVSGQSWSVNTGSGVAFQLMMAFSTLVIMAVPAQLIGGRTARAWALALAGMMGLSVPWFFTLAVERRGQDLFPDTLLVLLASYTVTYVVARLTRAATARWAEG
ncbi:hypothetical protein [Ornithinimicrobium tianjinense]|uniref:Uncharacterized protein n=1 Tax=Ornithinimicrobium tianjinense TaxID=1195761 RepID=A0A917BWG6_9MICO|nr:hypothetical protein [Ornithinimicrobium tianjinense]GGF58850.1 hypothetical protein GCM10011366_28360 [Ornithinimicrobium tianjinense]